MMNGMENRVFTYIEKHHMIEDNALVVAGVSGGADSMCMLRLLCEYQKKKAFQILVVHVHHGIRGREADRDAIFVEQYCNTWNLDFNIIRLDVPRLARENGQSLEEAARLARYKALRNLALEAAAGRPYCIAVAHHRNDMAETTLFHILRGSGIKGAAGIEPVRGDVIRPLLCCLRKDIEAYVKSRGMDYVTDSTNMENKCTRNRLRNEVFPYFSENINSAAVENVAAFADIMQETWEFLQTAVNEKSGQYITQYDDIWRIHPALFEQEPLLEKLVLLQVLENIAGSRKDIGNIHVEQIRSCFGKGAGTRISLPYGISVRCGYHGIYLCKGQKDIYDNEQIVAAEYGSLLLECENRVCMEEIFWDKNIKIPLNGYTKFFDCDKMKDNLCIRRRQPGDYIIVSEDGRHKLVKRYLIDCKVPRELRDKLVCVADGSHVLWIVGLRDSAGCRIDENTHRVMRVWVSGRSEDGISL